MYLIWTVLILRAYLHLWSSLFPSTISFRTCSTNILVEDRGYSVRKGIDFVSWLDGHRMFVPHVQHIFKKYEMDEIQFKYNYCVNSSDTTGHQSVMMYWWYWKTEKYQYDGQAAYTYNFLFNNPYTYYQPTNCTSAISWLWVKIHTYVNIYVLHVYCTEIYNSK